MSRIQFKHNYNDIISLENLLEAWKEFIKGKRKRADVLLFGRDLMTNIISLRDELESMKYQHSAYEFFRIHDPKQRDIHKASVRDRLVHRALYRKLYPFFDRTFISDSFSCRLVKGTHKAVNRLESFARKASLNHTQTIWILECDIKKFFASIDQNILLEIVTRYIPDKGIVDLISKIICSFYSTKNGIGLPLGNLTSQLLVNIYMNEFDQFVKYRIKAKYYIRYADDFVIISSDRKWLCEILPGIQTFLLNTLKLTLHPNKVSINTIASGVDFLGWINFPNHKILRRTTGRRAEKALKFSENLRTLTSYHGLASHGNEYKLCNNLQEKIKLLEAKLEKDK